MRPGRLLRQQAAQADKRLMALRSPIGRRVALDQYDSARREIQARILVMVEGEACRQELGYAAWIVGVGAELALHVNHPDTKRLHATLRGVMQCAQEGARWKERLALQLDQAVATSHTLMLAWPDESFQFWPSAEWLRHRIDTGQVDGTEIAGAEIYAATPTPTPTEERPQ